MDSLVTKRIFINIRGLLSFDNHISRYGFMSTFKTCTSHILIYPRGFATALQFAISSPAILHNYLD